MAQIQKIVNSYFFKMIITPHLMKSEIITAKLITHCIIYFYKGVAMFYTFVQYIQGRNAFKKNRMFNLNQFMNTQ